MTKVLTVILPWLSRRLLAGVTAVSILIGSPPEANQQVAVFLTALITFLVECLQKWLLLQWSKYRSRQTAATPPQG